MDSLSRDHDFKRRTVPDAFPKRLDSREINSLRGTSSKKTSTPPIPSTKIPEQYHVKQVSGTPPADPELKAEYDEKSKTWKTTIFPSLKPGGRQEVLLLDKWLNDMLAENLAKNLDPIDSVKEAQDLYSACFHEICRQVYVQCAERGKLMEKIWNRYLQLFDHILKIREREKFTQTQKLEQQKAVYQKLYKEKDEKFNKAYLQLAADKEKITMSKDKLERVVLVLQEEYKKKAKQEVVLKKAIKKMQNQISRHHLMSSSPSLHSSESVDLNSSNSNDGDIHKKRVRIVEGLENSDSVDSRKEHYDSDEHDFHRVSSSLSMQSVDSFSRYDEDEEEQVEESSALLNSEDIDFSNNNLILVNKLEFVTKSLRSIHKILKSNSNFEDDNYQTTQQLGSVLEAIVDVVNRMEHPENVQEQKTPTQIRALSTLSALRAPIDKAVQTMELEVSEAIPRAYASYFVKSFRVPVVHVKDKRYVNTCISYVYTQKIIDDEECVMKNIPRPPMSQYLYDLFLRIFGMRIWSEMHLLDFLASLRKYMQQNLKIKMFARFAHIGDELNPPYTTDDLNFYLNVLSQFRPQTKKSNNTDNQTPTMREAKDGTRFIAVKSAIETIVNVFPDIEVVAKDSLTRVIESCAQLDETDGLTQVVDMDKYMEVLLEEYHLRCSILSDRFQRLLEDNVSAPLPDNILLYDEFLICMNQFHSGVSESEVLAIYREILDASSSLNGVETSTVLEVVRRHDFFSWKHYSSKIDKSITDHYLLKFMEFVWETTKLDLQDKLRKIQLDSNIAPKVSSLLQERVRNFHSAISSNSGFAAMSLYRQLIVQIFFSSKKQGRIIGGGDFTPVEEPESPEPSPPPSP